MDEKQISMNESEALLKKKSKYGLFSTNFMPEIW